MAKEYLRPQYLRALIEMYKKRLNESTDDNSIKAWQKKIDECEQELAVLDTAV